MPLSEESGPALAAWLAGATGARQARVLSLERLGGGAIQENWALDVEIADGPQAGKYEAVLRSDAVSGIAESWPRAQEFALRHPERVTRLVLGCTRASGKDGPRGRLSTVLTLLSGLWLPEARALERTTPLVLSPAFLREHPEIVGEWQELAERFPTRRRALIGQLGAVLRQAALCRNSSTSTGCRGTAVPERLDDEYEKEQAGSEKAMAMKTGRSLRIKPRRPGRAT